MFCFCKNFCTSVWAVVVAIICKWLYNWWIDQKCSQIVGKIVVVTGAANGMGRSVVQRLLSKNASVIAVDIDKTGLATLQKENKEGTKLIACVVDISDEKQVYQFVTNLQQKHAITHVDVLVNAAGMFTITPWIHKDTTPAFLEKIMKVNFIGPVVLSQSVMPLLLEAKKNSTYHPRIINFSSQAGRVAMEFTGVYSASKFALEAFSDSLRQEIYETGVKVVKIQPGLVDTGDNGMIERANNMVEDIYKSSSYWPRMQNMRDRGRTSGKVVAVPMSAVVDTCINIIYTKNPKRQYPLYNLTLPCTRRYSLLSLEFYQRLFPAVADKFSYFAYK